MSEILQNTHHGITEIVKIIQYWPELKVKVIFKNNVSITFPKDLKLTDDFIEEIFNLREHITGCATAILTNNQGDKVHAWLGNYENRIERGCDLLIVVQHLQETYEKKRNKVLKQQAINTFLTGLV